MERVPVRMSLKLLLQQKLAGSFGVLLSVTVLYAAIDILQSTQLYTHFIHIVTSPKFHGII